MFISFNAESESERMLKFSNKSSSAYAHAFKIAVASVVITEVFL